MYSRLVVALAIAATTPLCAQICRISAAGLNRDRRVSGPVSAECPISIHSSPFGNWGATSNFGTKGNSHQFDGWCHDTLTCDNSGTCRTSCTDGWYEWNSCTDDTRFRAPNCSLYNSPDCTSQKTSTGINVHGTRTIDLPVSCPADSDGDGTPDKGGCSDIAVFTNGANFLSLYELDPGTTDDLIQTLYFPDTPVAMQCTPSGCAPAGSAWVAPIAWDSPASPAKIWAEVATVVNYGIFVDSAGRCATPTPRLSAVSAASMRGPEVAPDSLATAFGTRFAAAGPSLRVRDAAGVEREAPVSYASATQINFLVPSGTASGPATVSARLDSGGTATGTAAIVPVAPGLFSANANGQGVAAAYAIRVSWAGTQEFVPVYACTAACEPVPLDLGGAGDVYLILYGTGLRNAPSLSLSVGGIEVAAAWFGAQSQYPGLDQINALLPRALAGRGLIEVTVSAGGRTSNPVTLHLR